MRPTRAFLDANVIVAAQGRDLLFRAAEQGLVDVRWSRRVLGEVERTLNSQLGLSSDKARRLIETIERAFPDGSVQGSEGRLQDLVLPDPDDRHVLAAAVHGDCDLLITNNLRDFPVEIVESYGLDINGLDDALAGLCTVAPDIMAAIAIRQVEALTHPPLTLNEWLKRLSAGAPATAILLGSALGDDEFVKLRQDVESAQNEDGPRTAVRKLLDLLDHDDAGVDDLAHLVDAEWAAQLTDQAAPTPVALLRALRQRLRSFLDAPDEWGFGSATRIESPSIEIVKLVQISNAPFVAWEPMLVRAYLFRLEHRDGRWVLIELTGADRGISEVPG